MKLLIPKLIFLSIVTQAPFVLMLLFLFGCCSSDCGVDPTKQWDWASPQRPTSDWRPITEEDLESYLKECWDDSTVYDQRIVIGEWLGDNRYEFTTTYFYTHREPTLQGFSDYLKRKR